MNSPLTIFDAELKVFGGPGRYVQGRGILHRIGDFAHQVGRSAVLVADVHILPLVEQTIRSSCERSGISIIVLPFQGRLGPHSGGELAAMLGAETPSIVMAAGGGRAIDAGKALADTRSLRLITIPTVASNDAPTSKNYVLYDEHEMLLEVRHLARNPDFVVVDTALLASAPKSMFAAGLGDALSKKAEAFACAAGRGVTMFRSRPTLLAGTIAAACYDTLIAHGRAAYDTAGTGEVTGSFEAAVEAMILMAGLGFESGGLSVPHALTRGLPLLPGVVAKPHGLQVAYGLVVHHRLLGEAMPAALLDLYRHAGLPLCLSDLTSTRIERSQLIDVAQASIAVPHMLNFPRTLTVDDLVDAMLAIEAETIRRPAVAN